MKMESTPSNGLHLEPEGFAPRFAVKPSTFQSILQKGFLEGCRLFSFRDRSTKLKTTITVLASSVLGE
jgi:hypothetical protein